MITGFFSLLFLIFMTLKLCGVITWSWWLVCMPLIGPTVWFLVILGVSMFCWNWKGGRRGR